MVLTFMQSSALTVLFLLAPFAFPCQQLKGGRRFHEYARPHRFFRRPCVFDSHPCPGDLSPLPAGADDVMAEKAIKAMGGSVKRDGKGNEKSIIEVVLNGEKVSDAGLKELAWSQRT